MRNEESLRAVENGWFETDLVQPIHGSYCFSGIPGTVKRLFGIEPETGEETLPSSVCGDSYRYTDKLVVFFLDALGWSFIERYQEKVPALRALIERGLLSKLTAQFPSTTSAQVTTIHTGVPVGIHGIYEWNMYDPGVDRVISPLPWAFAGEHRAGALAESGIAPGEIVPRSKFFEVLRQHGVTSHYFRDRAIRSGPYDRQVLDGCEISLYRSLSQGLRLLLDILKKSEGPCYCHFYYDELDAISHIHGPHSRQAEEVLIHLFTTLDRAFFTPLCTESLPVTIILIADHGQVSMNPNETCYVDRELPNIRDYLVHTAAGDPIAPAGSPRDLFLHVLEDRFEELHEALRVRVPQGTKIERTETLVKEGYFCRGIPSERFFSRIGNMVLLPQRGESVYWYGESKFKQKFFGHHGGLSREEMEVPFLYLEP